MSSTIPPQNNNNYPEQFASESQESSKINHSSLRAKKNMVANISLNANANGDSRKLTAPPESPLRKVETNSALVSPGLDLVPVPDPVGGVNSKALSNTTSSSIKSSQFSPATPPRRPMATTTINNGLLNGGGGGVGGGPNQTKSPLPLSGRLQKATAQAPVVGSHHKKSNSLIGFDPLLAATATAEPVTPPRLHHATSNTTAGNTTAMNSTNTGVSLAPPSPSQGALLEELQKLAKDVTAVSSSPRQQQQQQQQQEQQTHVPSKNKNKQQLNKPKFGRGSSLTQKFQNLSPVFRSPMNNNSSNNNNSNSNSNKQKRYHRRTRSLETPEDVQRATSIPDLTHRTNSFEHNNSLHAKEAANSTAAAAAAGGGGIAVKHKRASTSTISILPRDSMMQDLYDVVQQQAQTQRKQDDAFLALPSLARPAPTSFLTGSEIVRSSEQDPSPFQMEIPALEQTLAAARLVQFVEQYRKEDLNFDLNRSLVGLNRIRLQAFVLGADTPANLTEAHRPIVESLLEAADDVTVAGFVTAQDADSADARHEAVLLERQMQLVVVFRGTTPEQAAKTSLFKKNNAKQNNVLEVLGDNEIQDCKVYTAIKQAYMKLEAQVFARLDKYMDENPFCEVVFTGHSMGGAMTTLAAYRYAGNRSVVRVSCQTYGSPKVGNRVFRQLVNSLPNLKVMRIENVNDTKCLAPDANHGAHVGHSIVLSKHNSDGNSNSAGGRLVAAAYKFDDDHDVRKHRASKPNILAAAFKKEKDIVSYVSSLEQMHQTKGFKWPIDYQGEDGTGVRGKDNEQRQVV